MKVRAITTVREPSGCWRLVKNINKGGPSPLVESNHRYGYIRMCRSENRNASAHRVLYERWIGPIQAGMTIDHLCRNTSCVNPGHMEVVTQSENSSRAPIWSSAKTHCIRGHEFTEANTRLEVGKIGKMNRRCRACHRDGQRIHRAAGHVRPRAMN